MAVVTGTAYVFRSVPRADRPDALAAHTERFADVRTRHRFSHGLLGTKVADLEGTTAQTRCGFGFLPTLDAAKAFADDLKSGGVYELGAKAQDAYQSSIFWPSRIPNAVDAYDPAQGAFGAGAFVVFRGVPDLSDPARMVPYVTAMKDLYERHGYRLVYGGQKAFDVIGDTVQQQIGIGTFPTVADALACHDDPAYAEVRRLREGFLYAFELTLYG
jgi:uncharacterized protein (DUF1330 family)